MRIKLTLRPNEKNLRIPINYQYPISATIYKIISRGSKEYSEWLHSSGYIDKNGKPHKLFTFSKLNIQEKPVIERNILLIRNFSPVYLFISSPMLEDFIQNFVKGLFERQYLDISNRETVGRFNIELVETLPTPEFSSYMRFKMLSPLVASTMKEYNGKLSQYYLRPDEPELTENIRLGLIKKYELLNHKVLTDTRLKFALDEHYIEDKGGPEKVTKNYIINENNDQRQITIKGITCPFTFSGNPELIKTAYESGIGEKNSLGFGMVGIEQ